MRPSARIGFAALVLGLPGCFGTDEAPEPAAEQVLALEVGVSEAPSGRAAGAGPPDEAEAAAMGDAMSSLAQSQTAATAPDISDEALLEAAVERQERARAAIDAELAKEPIVPDGWTPSEWPAGAAPAHKGLYTGTWEPDGPEGFDEEWIDEATLRETYTKRAAGRREWRGTQSTSGELQLDVLLRDRSGPAVAYVYTLLGRDGGEDPFAEDAFHDETAVLHVRHQGRIRVRVDGVVVLDEGPVPPGEDGWRTSSAPVLLTGPYDVVLVKVGRGSDELGPSMDFQLCVSTLDGSPLEGQTWNTMRPPGRPSDL